MGNVGHQYLVATFERFEEAESAFTKLGGKRVSFASRPLVVRPYEDRGEGPAAAGAASSSSAAAGGGRVSLVKRTSAEHPANQGATTVKLSNIPWDVTEDDLRDSFSSAGKVLDARIARLGNGRSAGWATITYSSVQAAEKAIREFDGALLNGREITVAHDMKK
jgi:hypothetical protein